MAHDQMLGEIAEAHVKLYQILDHSVRALARRNTNIGKRLDCVSDQNQLGADFALSRFNRLDV